MNHLKISNSITMQQLTITLATLLTGLIAGLFYAYSCSVNPGLGHLNDADYLNAMQSINRKIMNPVFFASFMGTLIVLPVATWFQYRSGLSTSFYLLLTATLFYVIGGFGITAACNVPLNEMLDKFDLRTASMADLARYRKDFEMPWNNFHQVRTIACILSFLLAIVACVKMGTRL